MTIMLSIGMSSAQAVITEYEIDLPDTLARDRELLADLLQRIVGFHADAEATRACRLVSRFHTTCYQYHMPAAALDTAALDAAGRLVAIARARYPVVEAWLYGSFARGEAREGSDVDVAIIFDATRHEARRMGNDLAEESFDLLMATGRFASPFTISLAEWSEPQDFSNPTLLRNIRHDGVRL